MAGVFTETSFTNPAVWSISLRLQLREQDHDADAFLTKENHAQAVDADADAAGGRHAVFERDEKIWLLLFAASLMLQRGAMGSFCSVSPGRAIPCQFTDKSVTSGISTMRYPPSGSKMMKVFPAGCSAT